MRSTVERCRSGELREVPYSLSDPEDRAIWTALQLYVDQVERAAMEQGEEASAVGEFGVVQHPSGRAYYPPAQLENALLELRDASIGITALDTLERNERLQDVMECLTIPHYDAEGGAWHELPAEISEAASAEPDGLPAECALILTGTLAPLARLLRSHLELL